MSEAEQQAQSAEAVEQQEGNALDQILDLMPKTIERDTGKDMVGALVKQVVDGTVTWDKSLSRSIDSAVKSIDEILSKQLAAILHHPSFQKLEGSWRGLNYMVANTSVTNSLRLNVLHATKRELVKSFERANAFDQSDFFKKIYTNEYDMFGADPYGALIGDYEFTNHPEDIGLLRDISGVCASAFCPFISAAGPELLGLESFTQLPDPALLEREFAQPSYAGWRSFRESEDSRFVCLTMPRVLSRMPYGASTKPIDEFNFEEVDRDAQGHAGEVPHDHFAWMNSSYAMGVRLTSAFEATGWCTRIRGVENGGVVENLPVFNFKSAEGDEEMKCPTECGISERREHELSKLGFLPLAHWKNSDYSVFVGGQTCQKPKDYTDAQASENAQISARLPYMMATSRISHYLKSIARDAIGSFKERDDIQKWLNNWIADYTYGDPKATAEQRAKFPLREARIEVENIPGRAGAYRAVAYLRPWLQMEELHASVRMVTNLPEKK